MSNLEKFKIKVLNKDKVINKSHTFRINLSSKKEIKQNNFKIGDTVKYINDNTLLGVIDNISDNELSVKWNDNTREHICDFSKICYVDDIETKVAPLNNQLNITEPAVQNKVREIIKPIEKKEEPKSELDLMFEQAFNNMDDEYNDIESANPNLNKDKEIEQNLKEQQMKRRIKSVETKIENKKIDNIKDKTIKDIISLMKNKNMLSEMDVNKEKEKLLKMNDDEIEAFKNKVCNAKAVKKTEAEIALEKIKANGPVIGDFSKFNDSKVSDKISNLKDTESRDLKSLSSNRQTEVAIKNENNLNLSGFKNLQGLTKPIQVIAEQKTPRQSIAESIENLDWTTITKVF